MKPEPGKPEKAVSAKATEVKPAAQHKPAGDAQTVMSSAGKPTAKPMRKRKRAAIICLHSLIHFGSNLLTMLLVLIVVLGALLGSATGRIWLLETLLPEILADTGYRLEFIEPQSQHLGHWEFRGLKLYYDALTLADLEYPAFEFNLNQLLAGRVDVRTLTASKVVIHADRFPDTASQDSNDSGWTVKQLAELPQLRIEQLAIEQFDWVTEASAYPSLKLTGAASTIWGDNRIADADLTVSLLSDHPGSIHLQANLDNNWRGELTLAIREQAGGQLGAALELPGDLNLYAQLICQFAITGQGMEFALQTANIPWQQEQLKAQGNLHVNQDFTAVSEVDLQLLLADRTQRITGYFSPDDMAMQLALNEFPILLTEPWQSWLKGGQASGVAEVTGSLESPLFAGNIHLKSSYQALPLDLQTELTGNLEKLSIREFSGSFGELQLEASGSIDLQRQTLDLVVSKGKTPLRYLHLLEVEPPEGLKLAIDIADTRVWGPMLAPRYSGAAKVKGTYKGQEFTASADLTGDIEKIEANNFRGQSDRFRLTGKGILDWHREQMDLNIDANQLNLRQLAAFELELPNELTGTVSARGRLKGKLSLPDFAGLVSSDLTLADFNLAGSANLNVNEQSIRFEQAAVTLDQLQPKLDRVASITADGQYFFTGQTELDAQFENLPTALLDLLPVQIPYAHKGAISGSVRVHGPLTQPQVEGKLSGSGTFNQQPFDLRIQGQGDSNQVSLDSFQLSLGDADLAIAGLGSREILDLHVKLDNFDSRLLNAFAISSPEFRLNSELTVSGSPAVPLIDGHSDLLLTMIDGGKRSRLDLFTEVSSVGDQGANTQYHLNNRLKYQEAALGSVEMRLPYSTLIGIIEQAQSESLNLQSLSAKFSTSGQFNLDWIRPLVDQELHDIRGRVEWDLDIKDRLSDPTITGYMRLEEGFYRHFISKAKVDDLALKLEFEGKRLSILEGTANDGAEGKLDLAGFVDWHQNTKGTVDLHLTARNVALLRRDEIEGKASGTLQVDGDFKELLVKGDVKVAPFRLMLDLLRDSSIPELKITRKSLQPELNAGMESDSTQIQLPQIRLDVSMVADRQAFILGRGLVAELQGNIKVTGMMDAAEYRGRFGIVRGTFELFGKKFQLVEGDVLFQNDVMSLFIEGKHTASEYDYQVILYGSLENLKIELNTTPTLPQDEAISQLLFGKSVQQITPIQAVRLAQAVRTLSGESGGFDPINTTRELLGVDSLSVDTANTSEGTGVAIGVGKYVTEKVYVELERTPESSKPWKGSIEVELTPKVFLEGTTDEELGSSSIELKWKRDY